MRLQAILLVIFLAVGTVFSFLNSPVVVEERTVQLPGGTTVTTPLVGTLMVIPAAFMLLMLLAGSVSVSLQAAGRRRLENRVGQRERELAEMKDRAYDEVSQKIDAVRDELSDQIVALGAPKRRLSRTCTSQISPQVA